MRPEQTDKAQTDKSGFRLRGHDMNRLEAFSDVVFGFAVTLLGISLEVPHTFADLVHQLAGFPAFLICFAALLTIWWEHFIFFRRFGLQDGRTFTLNAVLLAIVLMYVYPLKFLFTLLTTRASISEPQIAELMILYGAGYAAVWLVFAAMYRHAARRGAELELNRLEEYEARRGFSLSLWRAGIGGLAIAAAWAGGRWLGPVWAGYSGLLYFLLGPVITINEIIGARHRKALLAADSPEQPIEAAGQPAEIAEQPAEVADPEPAAGDT